MRAHTPTHSCHMRVLHIYTRTRTSQTDTHSTQVPTYTIHAHATYATRSSAHTPHTSAHVLSYTHTTQTHSYIHARAHMGPPSRPERAAHSRGGCKARGEQKRGPSEFLSSRPACQGLTAGWGPATVACARCLTGRHTHIRTHSR